MFGPTQHALISRTHTPPPFVPLLCLQLYRLRSSPATSFTFFSSTSLPPPSHTSLFPTPFFYAPFFFHARVSRQQPKMVDPAVHPLLFCRIDKCMSPSRLVNKTLICLCVLFAVATGGR